MKRSSFSIRPRCMTEQLSHLTGELEQHIAVLKASTSEQEQAEGERQHLPEHAQGERAALGHALSQNRQLEERLAELWNGFVHMSNDNAELGSALHTEQHVKLRSSVAFWGNFEKTRLLSGNSFLRSKPMQNISLANVLHWRLDLPCLTYFGSRLGKR